MRTIAVDAIAKGAHNVSLCEGQARSVQATLHAIASTIDVLREHVSRDLSTKLSEQFGRPVTVTIDVVGKDAADESRKALLNRVNKDILANVALVEKHLDNPTIPERFRRKLQRAKNAVTNGDYDHVTLFRELAHDLIDELTQPLFLCIDHDHRYWYESAAPFGDKVAVYV